MQAYVLFTYNKAINSILKPISGLRSDSLSIESWKLFKKYEDSTVQFREEIYYNDFLRLINSGNEPDTLIRLGKSQKSFVTSLLNIARCKTTGIITAHGFNFAPFTSDVGLAKTIKYYGRDYCSRNEGLGATTTSDYAMCYK